MAAKARTRPGILITEDRDAGLLLIEVRIEMRILVVAPKRKPKIQEIDGSLKSMQELVGGTIQAIYPFREPVALVANDEGKILGLPMNRGLRDEEGNLYDILHGTFFLCGIEEDRFASLGEEYILHFQEVFGTPELFVKIKGQLLILPYGGMDDEG